MGAHEKKQKLFDDKAAIAAAIVAKGVPSAANHGYDSFADDIAQIVSGEVTLQEKTVTPSASGTTVQPDSGYDGLSKVVVNGDSDLVASNIKQGVNIFGVAGSYNPTPALEERTIAPRTSQQVITPSSGKEGMSKVTVGAVTSSIDSNIAAGNIKKDVTILGVTGTYEGSGGGMNCQIATGYKQVKKTSLTATGLKLVVEKTGTYNISWAAWRNTTSGTNSTRVYVNGSAKGTDHTSWTDSYGQTCTETNISLTAGQTVEVYARSRSTSYAVDVTNLVIMQVS